MSINSNSSTSTSSSDSQSEELTIDPTLVAQPTVANFESTSDEEADTIVEPPTNTDNILSHPQVAAAIDRVTEGIIERITTELLRGVPPQRLTRQYSVDYRVNDGTPAITVNPSNTIKPREEIKVKIEEFLNIASKEPKFIRYDDHILTFPTERYNNEFGVKDTSKADTIKWLTISDSKTTINGLIGECKIQITAKSDVTFNDCILYLHSFEGAETPVEIFAASKATFNNCVIYDVPIAYATRPTKNDGTPRHSVGVVARDRTEVTFNKCKFVVDDVGVLAMDNSAVSFKECRFEQYSSENPMYNRFCIYAYRGCVINVDNSKFTKFNGKHILAIDQSTLNAKDMKSRRSNGAICIGNKSVANIDCFDAYYTEGTAIRITKESKLYMFDCILENTNGNGIQMENSTGIVIELLIKDNRYPAIHISGDRSNPIFERCALRYSKTNAVVVRHCARPVFRHIIISWCESIPIKASSFANFEMYDIHLHNAHKPNIRLSSRANLYLEGISIQDGFVFSSFCEDTLPEPITSLPPEYLDCSADSLYMEDWYDRDLYTMIRLCTKMNKRTYTPTSKNPTHTIQNGIHIINYHKPPNVKSCTEVNEEYLLTRSTVSHLMELDVEKISSFVFNDLILNGQALEYDEEDYREPLVHVYRTRDECFRAYSWSQTIEYLCRICYKPVNVFKDKVYTFVPCGHLCCEECFAAERHKQCKQCVECEVEITEVKPIFTNSKECCACLEMRPNVLTLPCCHVCTCYNCATACMERGKCPICNIKCNGMVVLE